MKMLSSYILDGVMEKGMGDSSGGFERRFSRIQEFLRRSPFDGFTRKDLLMPSWHSIAALSNMAEAIANLFVSNRLTQDEARELLEEMVRRAVHPKVNPFRRSLDKVNDFYKWGYYLEHLNICIGALTRVQSGHGYEELNHRVSSHLVENTMKYPNFHADLHARSRMKWPADQAAILYSLWLHDRNYGTDISREPMSGWFDYINNHAVHEPTGLYITEVIGVKKFSNIPRGCALSYLSHYVGRFAPDVAVDVWEKYKQHFLKKTLLGTGFREYPEDFQYRWTPDSGPIVMGLGAAATGIGLNAASTLNDKKTFKKIEKLLSRVQSGFLGVEKAVGNNLLTRVGTDLLATSIWLNAETKTNWFPISK
jgi:hypothetical protein